MYERVQGVLYRVIAVLVLVLPCAAAHAYIACTENLKQVIVHQDGHVYFATDGTCANGWCMLNWNVPARIIGVD
jgi:hypothetical protein